MTRLKNTDNITKLAAPGILLKGYEIKHSKFNKKEGMKEFVTNTCLAAKGFDRTQHSKNSNYKSFRLEIVYEEAYISAVRFI